MKICTTLRHGALHIFMQQKQCGLLVNGTKIFERSIIRTIFGSSQINEDQHEELFNFMSNENLDVYRTEDNTTLRQKQKATRKQTKIRI